MHVDNLGVFSEGRGMAITINGNPVDSKIARVLRAAMAIKRRKSSTFTREGAQRTLDVVGNSRINQLDYLVLKKSIRARWFTSAFLKHCVKYIEAVPLGSARVEYLGRGLYGRGAYMVKLTSMSPKGMSVRIEVMKSARLKLVIDRSFTSRRHAMPRLIECKPIYIRSKLLERDGFKLRNVRKSAKLPAGVHRILTELARKALENAMKARLQRSRPQQRRRVL